MFRTFTVHSTTEAILYSLRQASNVVRSWPTGYRGPIAFIVESEQKIVAIAKVDDVILLGIPPKKYESPETGETYDRAYMWKLSSVKILDEPMPAPVPRSERWESPRGLEPPHLNAEADDRLLTYLRACAAKRKAALAAFPGE